MEEAVHKAQQEKMLHLVAQSFCKELLNYGVGRQDIVTVSLDLLDYAIGAKKPGTHASPSDVEPFAAREIQQERDDVYRHGHVCIEPFAPECFATVASWLADPDLQQFFASKYPEGEDALFQHFFGASSTRYFAIRYQGTFVGLIGGEQVDPRARKLEMKKFIGEGRYRGLGIGKTATFLWLHYVFHVLDFNKVYLYSLDTNIRNINLNSTLGFELEGTLFEDVVVDGGYRDVVRMSLLRSRWEALFGTFS